MSHRKLTAKQTKAAIETRPVGRPSKLTMELITRISERIRNGSPFEIAYRAEGISRQLANNWLLRGQEEAENHKYTEYVEFFQEVDQAKAIAISGAYEKVFRGHLSWQASARWLESADRDNFIRTEKRQVEGDVNIHRDPSEYSEQELIAIIEGRSGAGIIKAPLGPQSLN